MCKKTQKGEEKDRSSLFVLCIALLTLATAITNTITNILLLEIASTFQINEGIAAQIKTTNASAEVITALIMIFLSIRFKHKSLLTTGSLLVIISAIGSFVSPTFTWLIFFSFMEGIGTVMISIMAFTLIGDLLPSNRKVKAISWVVAAGFASTLIVTPLIDLITKIEGWRYTFLLPLPPVIIAVLIFSSLKIHSKKVAEKINPTIYLEKFKQVFQNKSALSFLIGTLFFTGAGSAAFIFAFLRQQFLIPREYIVYIIQIASVIFIIGSIMVGKIGNRFGSKKLAVIGSFGSGICLILLFFSPNVWLALAFNFLQVAFTAISLAAYPSLAVDQIQHSRSTIMSLTRVFSSMGNTITPAIGGSLLVLLLTQSIESGYQAVGLTFGVMNIISAIIIYILTKDPLLIQKPKILNPQSNTDTSVEA